MVHVFRIRPPAAPATPADSDSCSGNAEYNNEIAEGVIYITIPIFQDGSQSMSASVSESDSSSGSSTCSDTESATESDSGSIVTSPESDSASASPRLIRAWLSPLSA